MQIVIPAAAYLPGYVAALKQGYSPDNVRGAVAAQEILARIESLSADAFTASLEDREAKGPLVALPDGRGWDGPFIGRELACRQRAAT